MNFVTMPAHKFLHIKNYESNGYWDFWRKQNLIPGQDYETICGLHKQKPEGTGLGLAIAKGIIDLFQIEFLLS